jgi:hypothetical protein
VRISSIFVRTNKARLLFSFGSMDGLLVRKLVKPTKVLSRTPDKNGVGQGWVEANYGTRVGFQTKLSS